MTKKHVLAAAGVALGLNVLFPPWRMVGGRIHYDWLGSGDYYTGLALSTLILQGVFIVIAAGVALLFAKS